MNCSYIHSVHGCSAQLAWSFCTEIFFTRLYRRGQAQSDPERADNDPSGRPKPSRNRAFNFGNLFTSKQNETEESGNPEEAIPIPMYLMPLRRSQSVSQLRNKHTDSTNPSRIQSQLNRALAAFQPYPGMSASPPPPDYVNDPIVGTPLETNRPKPTAPVTTSEVARCEDEVPPLPARVNQAAGPAGPAPRTNRTPTLFAFTPIPTPRADTPPVPAREPIINRPSSDDPPPLPSR